jgi:putative tryptophan/tyrosine transport system substrate-binding protein
MRRREFITLVGGATAVMPLTSRAQPMTIPRIGILLFAGPDLMGPFPQALHDLGYVEGKNIQIETRSAEGGAERLPGLVGELIRSKVDIIVASLTPAVVAAKNATRDIPIVMAPAGDPIGMGLVGSFARPGGNITGVSANAAALAAKSLELIPEIVPGARRAGVLGNANDPFTKPFLESIQKAGPTVPLEIQTIVIRGSDEVASAFAAMVREHAEAVVVQPSLPLQMTVDMALKFRLPSLSLLKSDAKAGRLASYSPNAAEMSRQIAGYVDKILKGAKPADLPVQQPTLFEITINLRTAKALGLTISPMLLARADEVIE